MTDMCFVSVPHPLGMIPVDEVKAKIDKAFPEIVDAATKWQPKQNVQIVQEKPYPARHTKFKGDYTALNKAFQTRKWSLGLPVIPPTQEAVAAMLKGTKRSPSEVVWVVPPRQGMLTVELVAALGVMAGAQPEDMPLLLATVEAFKHPDVAWRGTSTTTAATNPIIIISGPIIEKRGLNAGTGTCGPENPTTNALGYFINLVGDVVGGSVPPDMDKSTHGTTADFVAFVYSENVKATPWKKTFAEDQGFSREDNVVTVMTAYPSGANIDHWSATGSQLLDTIAFGAAGAASGIGGCLDDYTGKPQNNFGALPYVLLVLGPEHAQLIASEFPEKQAAKEYLQKNTARPYYGYAPTLCPQPKDGPQYERNTLVPRFKNPNSFFILVSGGPGKQSQIWAPFPQVLRPVSVKIQE